MIARLFRRAETPPPIVDQRAILADLLERSLEQRRAERPERQAAARDREARKFHAAFTRDPLIRAVGHPSITNGE